MHARTSIALALALGLVGTGCSDDGGATTTAASETSGDGDGDPSGDGDGDPSGSGDGDGDTGGDGDGDPSGDGDGDDEPCGNGVLDEGEECDEGEANADDGACTLACTEAVCGDGLVYPVFEECDDGNDANDDACVEGCVAATCHDGFLFVGSESDVDCGGEQCEPCGIGLACVEDSDCFTDHCSEELQCGLANPFVTVTITNEGDEELSDWQVPIELTPETFVYADAAPGGADLRASSDGLTLDLPYWIDTWDPEDDSVVWVKVPTIPAGGSVDIYLLYGTGELEDASDGEAVFEFFDDHEDGDWTDKWSSSAGVLSQVEEDGALTVAGDSSWGYAASLASFDYELEIHTDLLAGGDRAGLVIADDDTDLRYLFSDGALNGTGTLWDPDIEGNASFEDNQFPGVYLTIGVTRRVTCALRLVEDQVEIIEYCDDNACSDSQLLTKAPFSAVRVGLSNFRIDLGPITSELLFIAKHTEAVVSAVVN